MITEDQALQLLQRAPLPHGPPVNLAERTILVTGAAGSIGQAIVAGLRDSRAARLLLHDRDESGLRALQLRHDLPARDLVLGDLGEHRVLPRLLADAPPDAIIHAAAVKHLPLLQHQLHEAVRTNVLATSGLLTAAREMGVRDLVFISSDKAARPSSVLGATKRVAERVLHEAPAGEPRVRTLRLANVLGSRGSVLDRWLAPDQGDEPLLVATPPVSRWFVTATEAARLAIDLLATDQPEGIHVPALEEPLLIADLFERLAGLHPHLRERTRRPWDLVSGEVPEEVLHAEEETVVPSGHPALLRITSETPPIPLDLSLLLETADAGIEDALRLALFQLVDETRRP